MINKIEGVNIQTLKRLPLYLDYLEKQYNLGNRNISTPMIANVMGLSEITVKKDLAYCTNQKGKPKIGHQIIDLITDIKTFLGCDNSSKAVLVGAGKLGSALLGYNGFKKYNLEIVMAFDSNPDIIDSEINSIKIYDEKKLEDLCLKLQVHIGIITVSEKHAQQMCDRLVGAGIQAIWNFAPVILKVPENIIVQNENLASGLAVLSKKLSNIN